MIPTWYAAALADEDLDPRPLAGITQFPTKRSRTRRRRSQRHRRKRRLIAALVVLAVLLGIGATLVPVYAAESATLQRVQRHMTLAEGNLKEANGQLKSLTPVTPPEQIQKVQASFDSAYSELEAARIELSRDKVLSALQVIPGARQQLTAVLSLIRIGEDAIDAGRSSVDVVSQLHVLSVSQPGLAPSERVYQLAEKVRPLLDKAVTSIKDAQASRKTIDDKVLLPQLRSKLPQIDRSLSEAANLIETYSLGMGVLLPALGKDGLKNYLVVFMDTAELRGAGGLIGTYGVLTYDKGKQSPLEMKDVYLIDQNIGHGIPQPGGGVKFVPPPKPISEKTPGWSWRLLDSAWSPDWPTTATQAETLFKGETGISVDGVIGVDQVAAQEMLRATGPIQVPGYNVTVTADNLLAETVKRIETNPKPGEERKTFLSVLAKVEMDKITHLSPEAWPEAVKALQLAIAGRHLQAYINESKTETFLGRLSVDSPLKIGTADDMVAVVDNQLGYSKVAVLVDRNYSDSVTVQPDGTVQHELTLAYKNNGKVGDITFGSDFENYLRVFVPKGAKLVSQSGFTKEFEVADTDGMTALQGWAIVPAQQSRTIKVAWTVHPAQKVQSAYSLLWRKQAGVINYPLTISVTDAGKPATPAASDTPGPAVATLVDRDRNFSWKG